MSPRKLTTTTLAVMTLFLWGVMGAMAAEEASYETVKQDQDFEIRDYAPQVLAEIIVQGDLEEAGGKAFKRLYDYISGENRSGEEVAMTAPVSQQPASEKIEMTSPVEQERRDKGWAVSFMMPEDYSLETLPTPNDPEITFRKIPARRIAVVRYSGFWSEENYRANLARLEEWIGQQGLSVVGEPIWARYDPPFMPWFMRRNEVLIPVEVERDTRGET